MLWTPEVHAGSLWLVPEPSWTLTNGLDNICPLRSHLQSQCRHWALTWPLLHLPLGSEPFATLAQMPNKGRGFLPDWPLPLGVTVSLCLCCSWTWHHWGILNRKKMSTFSFFMLFLLRSFKVFWSFHHLAGRSLVLPLRTKKLEEKELQREEEELESAARSGGLS